ncbi:GNAT family N-acetyltransferase [Paenibacillus puldeungensis]|uniref:GNAT family N-acetyltransferase n=1 Tax=Paenibacillus puldeungensis TaxID=696536 RepID=A0ABW3S103_9BACL
MNIVKVNRGNVGIFSRVLIEASEWLNSKGLSMWKANDVSVQALLEKYSMEEMRLCYDDSNLIGVYVIQCYDPLFWSELRKNESGYLHKLAVCREYCGKGFGRKLIYSAEQLCRERGIESLRLNCGTFRPRLRNFYEGAGFKMLDRVFIDNRDQIRYIKKLV